MIEPAGHPPPQRPAGRARDVLAGAELRWTIMVVVLAVAGIIALLPATPTPAASNGTPGPVPQTIDPSRGRNAPAPDDTQLAPLRRQAALAPCPLAPSAPSAARAPRPGNPAPPPAGPLAGITVPCLGAPGRVDLATALAGRAALLNIWASWCGPCRAEIPVLDAYTARPDAIAVIGIDVQDQPAVALDLLTTLGAHYPSVTDPDAALLTALHAPPVLPTSYVLRPDGSVSLITPPTVFRNPSRWPTR